MFYTFNQNNSGGSFIIDSVSAPYVIIEASCANQANELAEIMGLYFNGVDEGMDCECCGDRWYPMWDDERGTEKPEVYGSEPSKVKRVCVPDGAVNVRVFYQDGTREEFY